MKLSLFSALAFALWVPVLHAQQESPSPSPAATSAPYITGAEFPIGVWLQDPSDAERYKAAGINLFVGLPDGLTDDKLAALARSGISVVSEADEGSLARQSNPVIVGWMHGDQPDCTQTIPKEKGDGDGPPIPPEKIVADYARIKKTDPVRPVLLNLSQAIAWDGWEGRGPRTNHPEDYAQYLKGSDIASFRIDAAMHNSREIRGKLEYVFRGVERLTGWAGLQRRVWSGIECARVSLAEAKPKPAQVRTEVWMAIIGGARGLIYYCDDLLPEFQRAALLDDPGMVAEIRAVNRQIQELAPVLAGPNVTDAVRGVKPGPATEPIVTMAKQSGKDLYVFAVNITPDERTYGFLLNRPPTEAPVEVLGEGRQLTGSMKRVDGDEVKVTSVDAGFIDAFKPYDVHIYRIKGK